MKALMMNEYKKLELVDAEKPAAGEKEVLIRLKASGICGSDVHGFDGSTGRRVPPLIMGHESSGVIESVGPGIENYAAGDRVTFDSTIYCGECRYCREGNVNFCENRQVLGVSCDEYRRHGTFAEYVTVPERVLYRLPENVSFPQGAMIEPLSVAAHGVRITPLVIGDDVLLIGAGVIGLLVLQVLRTAGAGRVFVADIDDDRLAMAKRMGADETFNVKGIDLPAEIRKLSGGLGVPVSIDAVGTEATVQNAIYSVRKGGFVTSIGNIAPEVTLPLQYLISRQITIRGSNASSGEYGTSLQLLQSGRVSVDPLISAVAPLEEGAAWFGRLYAREKGLYKVILEP
jgi:L-iditol 2-dehydrogenase